MLQLQMNSTLRAFGRAIHLCFTLYMIFVCSCLCYHCHGQGPCYDCNHFHCVCVNGNNSHLVIHVIFIIMFLFTIIVRNNSPCGHLVHDCAHLIHYHGCHHHIHDHGCLKPHLDILCMIYFIFKIDLHNFAQRVYIDICMDLHNLKWIYIILRLHFHECEWEVYTNVG